MTAKTGSANIVGTMTESIEILTANLEFSPESVPARTTDNPKWQYVVKTGNTYICLWKYDR